MAAPTTEKIIDAEEVLGLSGKGRYTKQDLTAAYKAAIKASHPDFAKDDADKARRTQESAAINAAYKMLAARFNGLPKDHAMETGGAQPDKPEGHGAGTASAASAGANASTGARTGTSTSAGGRSAGAGSSQSRKPAGAGAKTGAGANAGASAGTRAQSQGAAGGSPWQQPGGQGDGGGSRAQWQQPQQPQPQPQPQQQPEPPRSGKGRRRGSGRVGGGAENVLHRVLLVIFIAVTLIASTDTPVPTISLILAIAEGFRLPSNFIAGLVEGLRDGSGMSDGQQ